MHGLLYDAGDKQVPLKEIQNNVSINGLVASVESDLYYTNNEDLPLETEFVFPLDSKSAVFKFEAEIDGKKIVAECQEIQQALETYQDAMSAGHSAMYLGEDEVGDVFRLKLGNLPAKADAKLTIGYVVELAIEVDVVKFVLPTVLNPRYTPDVGMMDTSEKDDAVPTSQRRNRVRKIVPPETKKNELRYADKDRITYSLTFTAVVCGAYKIQKITSTTDAMDVQVDATRENAKLELSSKFKFDHDIELSIYYEDFDKPEFVLERGLPDRDGLLKEDVLMLNFVPKFTDIPDIKCEFVFVMDRSGSMMGQRITKAKETLLLLLKSLPITCKFNIVSFGTSYEALFPQSQEYTPEKLQTALDLQERMDADMGGTEIFKPFRFIYNEPVDPEFQRQIFLMTDGQVGNTGKVIAIAKKHAKTTRVFTFGIGNGSSTELIRGVARVSQGKATFIRDEDRFQAKVLSVLQCSTQPGVTNLTLEWDLPSQYTAISIPSEIGTVFNEDKMILYSLIKRNDKSKEKENLGSLTLKGQIGKSKLEHKMNFDLVGSSEIGSILPIHRMAAKSQIKDLEDKEAGGEKQKEKIILVSTSANIVSKYTAFVGVDKESRVPVDVRQVRNAPSCSDSLHLWTVAGNSSFGSRGFRCGTVSHKKGGRGGMAVKRKCKSVASPSKKFARYSAPEPFSVLLPKKKKASAAAPESFSVLLPKKKKGPAAETSPQPENKMLELISKQKFSGFWELESSLAKILKNTLSKLKQQNPVKSASVWATILALTYLHKHHQDRKVEWTMIEKKAKTWLQTQDLEGKSENDLRKSAESVIN